MKIIFISILIAVFSINSFAQADGALAKLVEEEKAFAAMAEARGNKPAFLEYLAKDGIVFEPGPVNAQQFWSKKPDSMETYLWYPVYADISSNGVLGYTTGPWEYVPKGKGDTPVAFGHYISVWQKQPDGRLKAVLDIGISHDKTNLSKEWTSPADSGKEMNEKKMSAADASTVFYETAEKQGLIKAYKAFAANDIRLYRDGKTPFIGKKAALGTFTKTDNKIQFYRRSVFVSAADMAYVSNSYSFFSPEKRIVEKGNFLQIWKLRKGKWEIVIDLFAAMPPDQN